MLRVTKCKRCGKEISTLDKPIHTNKAIQQKYAGVCANCMSDKEKAEMYFAMNDAVYDRFVKN